MKHAALERQILFFGGKGGVGKTTLAAAHAIDAAERGVRTLLVSTDPAHSVADVLGHRLGGEVEAVRPNLWALEIDPEVETERYIAEVKERVEEVTSPRLLREVEREIDVARVSPGAEEAALFQRFAELMQRAGRDFDRVIFDTAPTGHTLRLLALPELMTGWMDSLLSRRRKLNTLGQMWRNVAGAAASEQRLDDPVLAALERRQALFRAARRIVTDPRRAAFVFVLIPERLPILETRKAVDALRRYEIPIGALIVNRVLPPDAEGAFLARRRQRELVYLQEIREQFADRTLLYAPMFDSDVCGVDALRRLTASLTTGGESG